MNSNLTQCASFDALVLAGSRDEIDPMAAIEGYRHKALIEIEGKTMLERVVSALRDAGAANILVSCNHPDVEAAARELGATVTPTATGPSGSILKAVGDLPRPMVVTTADHALLQSEWVTQLIGDCPPAADIAVMFANRTVIEAVVPETHRTYYRFADGQWSGCNLFLLRTPRARRALELWQKVETERKKPWKIVARLGMRNLLDYLSGRLTIAEGVRRVGDRIGIQAGTVAAINGMAAIDVDKPDDLIIVLELLRAGLISTGMS